MRKRLPRDGQVVLPKMMTLEEAYGSVTPIARPEDFAKLKELTIEDKLSVVKT